MKNTFKSCFPCIACSLLLENGNCYHHLYSRKAHAALANNPRNMISVCLKHHNEFHSKGISYMAETYPSVKEWLDENGWEFVYGKWRFSMF